MITYKPINDASVLKQRFTDYKFCDDLQYGCYTGFDENGEQVGKCLFSIDGYKCNLISIECDFSDKLLVEGFIRASLNYCANRNAYMSYCSLNEIEDVLLLLGYEKNKNIYCGDIPSLLKGSCCK